jgi:crossover junction endodeoxyribonuclease RusA
MKPYYDGIADALKVNDSRFLPTYHYAEPVEHGRIVVSILP